MKSLKFIMRRGGTFAWVDLPACVRSQEGHRANRSAGKSTGNCWTNP